MIKIKTDAELELQRVACKITKDTLIEIEKQRKIGILYQLSIERRKVGEKLEKLKDNLLKCNIEKAYIGGK